MLFQYGILQERHDVAHVFVAKGTIKPFSFSDMLVTKGVKINLKEDIVKADENGGDVNAETKKKKKMDNTEDEEEVELMKKMNEYEVM